MEGFYGLYVPTNYTPYEYVTEDTEGYKGYNLGEVTVSAAAAKQFYQEMKAAKGSVAPPPANPGHVGSTVHQVSPGIFGKIAQLYGEA